MSSSLSISRVIRVFKILLLNVTHNFEPISFNFLENNICYRSSFLAALAFLNVMHLEILTGSRAQNIYYCLCFKNVLRYIRLFLFKYQKPTQCPFFKMLTFFFFDESYFYITNKNISTFSTSNHIYALKKNLVSDSVLLKGSRKIIPWGWETMKDRKKQDYKGLGAKRQWKKEMNKEQNNIDLGYSETLLSNLVYLT